VGVGTGSLRDKLVEDLGVVAGRGYRVKTWEKFLLQPTAPLIFLDDIGVFPPIFDLLLLVKPEIQHVCFTGDLAQGVWEMSSSASGASRVKPTADLVSKGACDYYRDGYRLAPGVAAPMGLNTRSTAGGSLMRSFSNHGPLVVSTVGASLSYRDLQRPAYGPRTCQGLTFDDPYTVLIDKFWMESGDRAVYTALTRGKRDLHIANTGPAISGASGILGGLNYFLATGDSGNLIRAVRSHRIRFTPPQLADPLKLPGSPPPPIEHLLIG